MLYLAAEDNHKILNAHFLCKIYFQDPLGVDVGKVTYQASLTHWVDFQGLGVLVYLEDHSEYIDLPPLPYPRYHVMALEAAVAAEFGLHRFLSRLTFDTSRFPMPLGSVKVERTS